MRRSTLTCKAKGITQHTQKGERCGVRTPLVQLHDMTVDMQQIEIHCPTMTVDVQLWPAVCLDDAWLLRKHADRGKAMQRPTVGLVHVCAVHAVVA